MKTLQIFKREDRKWAWRLRAENGQIIATDGGQGYEHVVECERMALEVILTDTTEVTFERE